MSLHELEENRDQERILPLFPSLDHHLAMESVIEGNIEGKILVDSTENPKTAAVWCSPGNEALLFLAGKSNNSHFNGKLRSYFVERIRPDSMEKGLDTLQVYCPHNWEGELQRIFGNNDVFKDRDSYYKLNSEKFRKLQQNWRENIPHQFILKRMEANIFDKAVNVPVFNRLSSWKSFEQFRKRGFAYYLVEKDTHNIVSGCVTKFATASKCELGIGTDARYRMRGLATLAVCATVEEALERGLEVIWECYHGNTASIRTNQKVGFDYICDEFFYFWFLYESPKNCLFSGYYCFTELNDPYKAVDWFRKGIALSEEEGEPISSGYNLYAACAFAAVKEYDRALEHLHEAVDGLQDAQQCYDRLKNEKAFDELRGSKEFKEIVLRVESLLENDQ
ncbi:MAG: GNAT family N-acetyltransferase [Theionarchaea archaeon]|nr:GNAT family N-acetyltransferase [Theionarchaea archaeon]